MLSLKLKEKIIVLLGLVAPIIGMLSSFLMSTISSHNDFASFTLINAQSMILASLLSFGFTGYFMGHKGLYCEYRSQIRSVLLLFPTVLFIIFLFFRQELTQIELSIFLLVCGGVLAVFFSIDAQIEGNKKRLVVSQSALTIIKALASFIFVLISILSVNSQLKYESFIILLCLPLYIIAFTKIMFPLGIKEVINFLKIVFLDKNIYFSWLSTFIAFFSVFFIPLYADIIGGIKVTSYFGIYMMFVSVSLVISQLFVINRAYSSLSDFYQKREMNQVKAAYLTSIYQSVTLFVYFVISLLTFVYFLSEKIWVNYEDIKFFLIFTVLSAGMKILQSSTGLVLTFSVFVKFKVGFQIISLIVMLVLSGFVMKDPIEGLLFSLLASEFFLVAMYAISGVFLLAREVSVGRHKGS